MTKHKTEDLGNHAKILKAKELPDGSVALAIELSDGKYVLLSLMQVSRCEVYTPLGTDMLGPDPIVVVTTTSTQNRVIKGEDFDALSYDKTMAPVKQIENR